MARNQKNAFRKWGWAYDLDEHAPTALIFEDEVVLTFEPMNETQKRKLTGFISLLNEKKVSLSPRTKS